MIRRRIHRERHACTIHSRRLRRTAPGKSGKPDPGRGHRFPEGRRRPDVCGGGGPQQGRPRLSAGSHGPGQPGLFGVKGVSDPPGASGGDFRDADPDEGYGGGTDPDRLGVSGPVPPASRGCHRQRGQDHHQGNDRPGAVPALSDRIHHRQPEHRPGAVPHRIPGRRGHPAGSVPTSP